MRPKLLHPISPDVQMLDRRRLLASAAAGAALPLASGLGSSVCAQDPATGKARQLTALLDQFMQERLQTSPELATSLGMDKGVLAAEKSRLDDASQQGVAAIKAQTASHLARLRALGREGLSGIEAVNYDAVLYGLQAADAADRTFDFGQPGARSPYVLSQLTGAYQSVPTFLDTQHRVETAADADAYLARLQAFATVLDQETERARRDAGLGVIPPDFILDKALEQITALRDQPAASSVLVASLARRAREKALSGDHAARAAAIYAAAIQPALERQAVQLRAMRARAVHDAGIGTRPQGGAYYAAGLRAYTTSALSAAEVHRLGLEQTRAYQAEIDTILKVQGLTKGSVGARLAALSTDPKHLYPNTDAGKAVLIAHLNELVRQVTPALPRDFHHPPTVPLEIRRVPPYIEAGAPLGYYQSASLDGTRPAIYYINLLDTAEWPRWLVSSVTFHEGVPGHHLQISIAQHIEGLPLIRKTAIYSGYAEGWALYAEQLADELGMYADDPLGRIGYLKSELWRACRMVLDTGIHTLGWSRERAIRWKMDNDGSAEGSSINEVERYCVWPGQAPSYKIGHTVINRLRDQARSRLGARFDIKDFHDAVLNSGGMPLEVLETVVGRYMASGKA